MDVLLRIKLALATQVGLTMDNFPYGDTTPNHSHVIFQCGTRICLTIFFNFGPSFHENTGFTTPCDFSIWPLLDTNAFNPVI